jgi:LemA protein
MKKAYWVYGGLAFVAFVAWLSFNGLVGKDERVQNTYAQVQNVMQRQADLIPNLVETVKAYAGHESKTLTAVTEARSRLSAVAKMDPEKLAKDPDLQRQLIEAQQTMQRSVIDLNAVREAYPGLKANGQFNSLMSELSGSQNRITVERKRNQDAVQDFNRSVRSFPTNIIANLGGFTPRPYFQANESAQSTPQVKF